MVYLQQLLFGNVGAVDVVIDVDVDVVVVIVDNVIQN